jgi:arylsulfatase A-like enzyme
VKRNPHSPFVLLALTLACVGVPDSGRWETTAELTTRFAVATVHRSSRLLDLGTPDARPFLLSGWSGDRKNAKDQEFVISRGRRSELRIPLLEPRDLPVTFKCRPIAAREWNRAVTIELNGRVAGTVVLRKGTHDYSLTLSAKDLVAGENRLAFIYGADTSGDPRDTAPRVRWFSIAIGTADATNDVPLVDEERDLLFIPYGVQIDIPIAVDETSKLTVDRVDFAGGIEPRLIVGTVGDSVRKSLANIASSTAAESIDLERRSPDAILLSLRAESRSAASPGEGVYIQKPEIHSLDRSPDSGRARRGSEPRLPNILVYLVDTLRVDRLSTYGYDEPTSPTLDAFAERATLFEKAIGQSSWTRPSVASLFVGTWPGDHSVTRRGDALSSDAETLAEVLRRAGYLTAAFSTNPNVAEPFGFAQGFDHFDLMLKQADSSDANRAVFRWLEQARAEEPFFLYVQPADPHAPYLPPEPFLSRLAADARSMYERVAEAPTREIWESDEETLAQINALYDAEVAANDASFGELLDHLDELGLLDDMLVVFLSDHGEEFRDHGGWTHGRTLHVETLDFPLLVKTPGQRTPRRVGELAQHIDILPTITDLLGLEAPTGIQGRSLASHLESSNAPGHLFPVRPIFSHVSLVRGLTTSIVVGEWKLIDRQGRGERETHLYRWRDDPNEMNDLAPQFPIRTLALRSLLDEKIASRGTALAADEAVLSPEIEERLRALGYL